MRIILLSAAMLLGNVLAGHAGQVGTTYCEDCVQTSAQMSPLAQVLPQQQFPQVMQQILPRVIEETTYSQQEESYEVMVDRVRDVEKTIVVQEHYQEPEMRTRTVCVPTTTQRTECPAPTSRVIEQIPTRTYSMPTQTCTTCTTCTDGYQTGYSMPPPPQDQRSLDLTGMDFQVRARPKLLRFVLRHYLSGRRSVEVPGRDISLPIGGGHHH